MKIFVAGGTGAIGRPLVAELLAKGHAIVALTRSPEKAQALVEQGIEPAIANVFDIDAVKAVVSRAQPEIVIEQLTALPGADAVYYGTQMRGVSNAKAKRELNFQP